MSIQLIGANPQALTANAPAVAYTWTNAPAAETNYLGLTDARLPPVDVKAARWWRLSCTVNATPINTLYLRVKFAPWTVYTTQPDTALAPDLFVGAVGFQSTGWQPLPERARRGIATVFGLYGIGGSGAGNLTTQGLTLEWK